MLDPIVQQAAKAHRIDWLELIDQEPGAGLGNGGLGRLAACFLDSMATMQLPATGYGLRYQYGVFKQSIFSGWQQENADNWLRNIDPWEIARPHEKVEVKLNCSFQLRGGDIQVVPDRPSTLIGIPMIALWWAMRVRRSIRFGSGLPLLYPDDSTVAGQRLRFLQEYFLVAYSLANIVRRFLRHNSDWNELPRRRLCNSMIPTLPWQLPS